MSKMNRTFSFMMMRMSLSFVQLSPRFVCCSHVWRLMVLAIALVISGCARDVQEPPESPAYIPGVAYYQLLAEIGLERGEYLAAAEEYLNAALQSPNPALAERATEFAFEYGYEAYALSAAQRWLVLEPYNRVAHEYAGRLFVRRYAIDKAYVHWRAQLGPEPTAFELQAVTSSLSDEDNVDGVTVILKRLAREFPAAPELQLDLANAALRSEDADLALFAARRAALLMPDNEGALLLVAQSLAATGYESEAFRLLNDLLANGGSVMVGIEYVQLLAAVGRMQEANEKLAALSRQLGGQPDLIRMQALLNFAAGDWDRADLAFRQLLQAQRNIYECYYYLARIAMIQGEDDVARNYFSRVGSGRYRLPARIGLSAVLQDAGANEEAVQTLIDFADDYPRLALKAAPARAQLLFEQGRVDAALDIMAETLALQPDSLNLLITYSAMLDQAGQLDKALQVMERALSIAPMNANAINALGYTLANRTRHKDEAYELIRVALELSPDDPAIIDSMGWVLFKMGREAEALSYLEQANALMSDPEISAHLGEVLWASGEQDQARALFDRALQEFPQNAVLQAASNRVLN